MILSNGKIIAEDTPSNLVKNINAKMHILVITLSLIKSKCLIQLSLKKKINIFNKKISVSGDKSISIRWVLFSSLAKGVSVAENLLIQRT